MVTILNIICFLCPSVWVTMYYFSSSGRTLVSASLPVLLHPGRRTSNVSSCTPWSRCGDLSILRTPRLIMDFGFFLPSLQILPFLLSVYLAPFRRKFFLAQVSCSFLQYVFTFQLTYSYACISSHKQLAAKMVTGEDELWPKKVKRLKKGITELYDESLDMSWRI